ncbi:MAG: hypothetical protein V4481_02830 [Patescibacteria group bacterium]
MSSGVQFEEDSFSFNKPAAPSSAPTTSGGFQAPPNLGYGRPQLPSNTPKMAQWLMRHGIKSPNAAQTILVVVVIVNIIITFVVIKFFI